jgi:predicted metal-binding membrane protein
MAANAAITALAQVASMALGALIALVILLRFGKDAETDGLFAAYGVYGVLVVVAQSFRTTIVARLAEGGSLSAALDRYLGAVAVLFAAAAVGWWWTVDRMRGMDDGPWTALGTLGWFVGVWVVMMAAMMFPSVSPTIALYSRMTKQRSLLSPLVFAGGYLLTWSVAGISAFALAVAGRRIAGDVLAWDRAGRFAAAGTLVVAAVYELTPLKDVCLGKCRSPLGFLLGSWRDGVSGALRLGVKHGAWCVGCCWALMAGLFALGVMSVAWMAFVAALIAAEKTLPWRRVATLGTAAILLVLGVLLLAAPDAIPGLTIPGGDPMPQMQGMGA